MGSMLKADSERRELVRERRQARMERKQQRREARERKRSELGASGHAASVVQSAAEREVDAALDRVVTAALEHHDQITGTANMLRPANPLAATQTIDTPAAAERRAAPRRPLMSSSGHNGGTPNMTSAATRISGRDERRPRRESDIAAFRERRRQAADDARAEARARIARSSELACVADALAALEHPGARPWEEARQELERALQTGRIDEVGAAARRSMWTISRDAARSSRRSKRDPDLALAACVAYAIIARLPRTTLRSAQRARPAPHPGSARQRAFWR